MLRTRHVQGSTTDIDAVSAERGIPSTQEAIFGTVPVEREKVRQLKGLDFNANVNDETRAVCCSGPGFSLH